jgi:ubiquinone/menaquinone biosynthesis C-methylase UbiE
MGRWSREVARRFVPWLEAPPSARWLDVGCGTGALTSEVVRSCSPALICGVDRSSGYLHRTASHNLALGDATALPCAEGSFDFVVSGLVLNFVPDAASAISEMRRVARRGGTIGVYVWDYREGMEMLSFFWRAVTEMDPAAREQDERDFPLCEPEALRSAFESAGAESVTVRPIEVPARFASFEDYWQTFLSGQGPAFAYLARLDAEARDDLRLRLAKILPLAPDGSVNLSLRSWALRARN